MTRILIDPHQRWSQSRRALNHIDVNGPISWHYRQSWREIGRSPSSPEALRLSDRLVYVRAEPSLQQLCDHAGLGFAGIAVERHALGLRPCHDPAEYALQVAPELQSTPLDACLRWRRCLSNHARILASAGSLIVVPDDGGRRCRSPMAGGAIARPFLKKTGKSAGLSLFPVDDGSHDRRAAYFHGGGGSSFALAWECPPDWAPGKCSMTAACPT
jgi:hypothetical protein